MTAPLSWTDAANSGAFTSSQVARLLGFETASVASWLRGGDPLILSDYEPIEGRQVISFRGFLEARMLAHMISEGVPKRRLREVMVRLRAQTGERHPLAQDRAVVTDGFRIFQSDGDRLINLANDCYAEPQLMKPALRGRVVFQAGKATYYEPDPASLPDVRIDPRVAFGRPIVIEGGKAVPTEKLAEIAEGEGLNEAAAWFEISPKAVHQAVQFEERLAA